MLCDRNSKEFNFSIVGGDNTGTYQFLSGFYGLGSMLREFHRVINSNLKAKPFTKLYTDDILIALKGFPEVQRSFVRKKLTILEKKIMTVKWKNVQETQKSTLQDALSKIIWNFRSSYQSKINCSPFELHFKRKQPNTIWKQLTAGKPSNGFLDKGKTIHSKERAKDWNSDDRVEDGYKDTLISKKNMTPAEKGYDTDYPSTSKLSTSRLPLQSPF